MIDYLRLLASFEQKWYLLLADIMELSALDVCSLHINDCQSAGKRSLTYRKSIQYS